jgi:hypothetical protein
VAIFELFCLPLPQHLSFPARSHPSGLPFCLCLSDETLAPPHSPLELPKMASSYLSSVQSCPPLIFSFPSNMTSGGSRVDLEPSSTEPRWWCTQPLVEVLAWKVRSPHSSLSPTQLCSKHRGSIVILVLSDLSPPLHQEAWDQVLGLILCFPHPKRDGCQGRRQLWALRQGCLDSSFLF